MLRLLIIVLTLACASCAGVGADTRVVQAPTPVQTSTPAQSSMPAPEGWVLYPSPAADSQDLHCANYSRKEWKVEADGEGVKVSLNTAGNHLDPLPPVIEEKGVFGKSSKDDRHVLQVEDGWLVGLDAGEFGGGLWWFDSRGGGRKQLAPDNVVGFAKSSKGVLVMTGLQHLGLDHGRVLLITSEGGERRAEQLSDLGSAPRTFVAESPDSLLVMTTRGLARVTTNGVVQQLLSTNYGLLYPRSMTLSPSGVIHVGMRHFVTRLTPTVGSYKEEWFVPADCTKFSVRVSDLDCLCSGRE